MEYRLASINSGVEDQAEGTVEFLVGDILRDLSHVGELLGIGRRKLGHVRIMLARHHEHMYFGFRIDVLECVGGIVLIHFFAWNFSCDDLAEQAILVAHDAP